jgi:hypothetical protein
MEGTPVLQGCSDLSCQQQQQGTEEYINTTVRTEEYMNTNVCATQQVSSIETYVKVFRMYVSVLNLGWSNIK